MDVDNSDEDVNIPLAHNKDAAKHRTKASDCEDNTVDSPGSSEHSSSMGEDEEVVSESELDGHTLVATQTQRARRLEQQMDNERPRITVTASKLTTAHHMTPSALAPAPTQPVEDIAEDALNEPVHSTASAWPPHTDLVLQSGTSRLNLSVQSLRLQAVLKSAKHAVFASFCCQHAYETPSDNKGWLRQELINAAKTLGEASIADRIRQEDAYAKKLVSIPLNQVEKWRSRVFRAAHDEVESQYNLQCRSVENTALLTVAERTDICNTLMEWDHSYTYIFPFHATTRTPTKSKPYMLPIFRHILRILFTDKGVASDGFPESFRGPDGQYEMPQKLLALSATMVYAALDYKKRNLVRGKDRFNTQTYYAVYSQNLLQLRDIETKLGTRRAYHPLMRQLFATMHDEQPTTSNAPIAAPPNTDTDIVAIDLEAD
ncbi:hypothetical protein BDW22DRAFT_1355092 [Trametopsis cervina]|nr:hypothetical protein BDW22DRAFT_1355092 [Trametopsis cervina]